jgi:hypothetical protein
MEKPVTHEDRVFPVRLTGASVPQSIFAKRLRRKRLLSGALSLALTIGLLAAVSGLSVLLIRSAFASSVAAADTYPKN